MTTQKPIDETLGHDTKPHDRALGEEGAELDETLGHDTKPHDRALGDES